MRRINLGQDRNQELKESFITNKFQVFGGLAIDQGIQRLNINRVVLGTGT